MAVRGWHVETHEATVEVLHSLGVPDSPTRLVRIARPLDSALVLGKGQPDSDVDIPKLVDRNLSLVRRQSGGGAVLVEPDDQLWIDVVVPKGDWLWNDDVGKAFHWLGQVWKEALESCGVLDVTVHEGAMVNTDWSRKICFAGLGPGECLVTGKKVVGISQRRTRAGAVFQSSVLLHFAPRDTVELLHLSESEAEQAVAALSNFVRAVDVNREALIAAFSKGLENMAHSSQEIL